MYIKKNGTVYKGDWKNDTLSNVDEIIFKDKSKFVKGQLSTIHKYIKGHFFIPDIGHLYPLFSNNNPEGLIEMVHKNGFKWCGNCNINDVFLIPVNNAPKKYI